MAVARKGIAIRNAPGTVLAMIDESTASDRDALGWTIKAPARRAPRR